MKDLSLWVWLIILIGCTAGVDIVYYIVFALIGLLLYWIFKKMTERPKGKEEEDE